jgi:thioredoxin-like negative regulator of GroEL
MGVHSPHARLFVGFGLFAALLLPGFAAAQTISVEAADREFSIAATVSTGYSLHSAISELFSISADIAAPISDLNEQRLRRIQYRERWERSAALYKRGDFQEAAAYLKALVNEPLGQQALYEVRFRLGESFFRIGAFPGAQYYLNLAWEQEPHGQHAAFAVARLAEIAARLGDPERASALYARAPGVTPELSQAAYVLGRALSRTSSDQAQVYLARVLPDTRYYAEAQYHLGALAATNATTYPQAISHFTLAREAVAAEASTGAGADPLQPERLRRQRELIALALARVNSDAGRYDAALAEYGNVPVDGRYRDAALLESAWVLLRTNQVLPALDNVQRLLREKPESPMVLEASLLVGYLSIEQNHFDQAYGHFEDTRLLLEGLGSQLAAFQLGVTIPEVFYANLVEAPQATTMPVQIGMWVAQGARVRNTTGFLEEVREVEQDIRNLYRQIDQLEVLAAGARGSLAEPPTLDNRIRLELSDALYALQEKILRLRIQPLLKHISENETSILRSIRRLRSELAVFRYTPDDLHRATGHRQHVLAALADYLLRLHPEMGLDAAPGLDGERVAEVDFPLAGDRYLRSSRRTLANLSREVNLDDRWIDAALEYTIYLEDRLQGAMLRRMGIDDRFDFIRQTSVLFRQSAELQSALRELGNTLADIQDHLFLEMSGRATAERKELARYQEIARELRDEGRETRGLYARHEFGKVRGMVGDTAVRADLGALDTAWRVKELEDERVRELLTEKRQRLDRLDGYYADVLSTQAGEGPYPGVTDLNPADLAQKTGSVESPYGRELIHLGEEVIGLAKALHNAQLQLEKMQQGAEGAVLSPGERSGPQNLFPANEGRQLRIEGPRSAPRGAPAIRLEPREKP